MVPYPRTWVELDLPSLKRNLQTVRQSLQNSHTLLALVAKADAYGHGLIPIVRYALQHGVDWCLVATVQEGVALRNAGIETCILVLSPILPIEADQAIFYNLRILVEDFRMASALNEAALKQNRMGIVHLKVDTGLCRFGCTPAEAPQIAFQIDQLKQIELEGIATHLVDSGLNQERTLYQEQIFNQTLQECEKKRIHFKIVHMANSNGITKYKGLQKNMVRLGAFAYGQDPDHFFPHPLPPVLRWKTRITSIRNRPKGETVSYSATYTLSDETRLATLGVGYGDGYPRSLSNVGRVWIHGREAPVVGRVCMDQTIIDITHIPEAGIGDIVELLGENIRSEWVSEIVDTNPRELTTRIMSRVARKYIYESTG